VPVIYKYDVVEEGIMVWHNNSCSKCGGKKATDMMGREWCPKCVGQEMAKDVIKKVKFPKLT
jgi:ribosomal protein S27AE